MLNLRNFRLPFRDDKLFSILAFAVFVVPLAFSFQLYEKFETVKIALLLMLLGWVIAVFFVLAAKRGMTIAFHKPVWWVGVGLAVWILISAFQAPTILNGIVGTYPRYTSSAVFYIALIAFFLLLLFSLSKEKFVYLLHVVLLDGLVVALVGLLQGLGIAYYTGFQVVGLQRGPSLLGNPDFSGMFLAILVPIGLFFLISVKKRWQKIYYALNVIMSLAAIVVFASRGAWLGTAVGLLLVFIAYAVFAASRKTLLVTGAVLLVSAGLFYGLLNKVNPASLRQTFALTESNVSLRLYAWDIARQAIVAHPLLGTGPGNFQYFFQAHRGSNLTDQAGVFDDVHNLFLQLAATLGLPFFLAFLAILVIAVLGGLKQSWKSRDLLPATLVISLIVFGLTASFTPVASACFVVFAVLLAGLLLPQTRPHHLKLKPVALWPGVVAGLLCVLAGLSLIVSEAVFYQGYVRYYGGNFASAERLSNFAKSINPTDQLFSAYHAASEMQLGASYDKVSGDEDLYIKLYPLDQRGYLIAANTSFLQFLETHDKAALTRAINLLQKDISLDPNNSYRYSHVAFYYYAQGSLDQAQQAVEYSLKLYNNNIPGWLLLARIHQVRGETAAAQGAIANALKLNPDNELLQQISQKAKQATPQDFKDVQIPLLLNPDQIE